MLLRNQLSAQSSGLRKQKEFLWRVVGVLLLSEFCVLSSELVVHAATPVDAFIALSSAPLGAQLTPAIMQAGTYGTLGSWTTISNAVGMSVGPHQMSLPGPVTIGGTTYPAGYPTQSMAYDNTYNFSSVDVFLPSNFTAVTVAGYITLGFPNAGFNGSFADLVSIYGLVGATSAFAVMQAHTGNPTYDLHIESNGNGTIRSGNIVITPGATYWYNIKADFAAGQSTLNVYDMSNNLVGSVNVATLSGGTLSKLYFGQEEKAIAPGTTNYFEDTLIDYTNAAFPLTPWVGSTSPSPCDINGDGSTNVVDVQAEVNMALGIAACTNASGTCTIVSVQRVVNAALGGTCVTP